MIFLLAVYKMLKHVDSFLHKGDTVSEAENTIRKGAKCESERKNTFRL